MKRVAQGIWLLLDSRRPGGIESHVLQLADGLYRYGVAVKVVFLTDYGRHPLRDELRRRRIPVMSLDGGITTLWNALCKSPPAVVHTHGYKAGILGRLAARIRGIPVVTTFHAGEIPSGRLAWYDWLDRYSALLADQVFAVSPQIVSRLPVAARLADNFIDTTGLNRSSGEQIAYVGRLSHEKGPDHFIRLAQCFPALDLHVYGDGPQAKDLERCAPDNLHFHGHQEDMSVVWSQIGLLVMPSRYEGLPMAALEAMARGIPVLASCVGALDRLVDINVNGWLVTPGDHTALVRHLQQWMSMTGTEKESFRLAARRKVMQQFSSDTAIPRLINDYRELSGHFAS